MYRKYPVKRVAAIICAAVALSGATVYAAVEFELLPFIKEKANENAPPLIQTDMETIPVENATQPEAPAGMLPPLEDNSPVMVINETLFDGTLIHIYASETENGAKYSLKADGITVNGQHFPNLIFEKTATGYYMLADLSGIDLSADFTVSIPISIYEKRGDETAAYPANDPMPEIKRYENQEVAFAVKRDSSLAGITREAPAQRIDGEGFYADLETLKLTPTASNIKYSITFMGDDAKARADAYQEDCYLISLKMGSETLYGGLNSDLIQGSFSDARQTPDGYTLEIDWTLRAFQSDADEITVTPYAYNGDDAIMKTDDSFTIEFRS